MIIAWTKLFHAYFQATIGEKYFYKAKNGRYEKIDGDKKAWELKECIKKYDSIASMENRLNSAVVSNLQFFMSLRNKIEHRFWDSTELDIALFGECQALLYNYETLLVKLFGDDHSINTSLAYALQFSQLRTPEQTLSQKTLLSKDMQDIKKYIEKYRTDLPQEVFDSQEFSIKLLQIPKVSNTNRNDLAIEFVKWDALDEKDKDNYNKVTAIIKDKIVTHSVSNLNLLKPAGVIETVKEKSGIVINMTSHTLLWKAFGIRPNVKSKEKFETDAKYCIYDEPHNDYLYTEKWVDFLVELLKKPEFSTDENIRKTCRTPLRMSDYL